MRDRPAGQRSALQYVFQNPYGSLNPRQTVAESVGVPLRQFITEAVQEKLRTTAQEKPWIKHLGKLKHLHKERKQIEQRVEAAFEQIDPELWR